MNTCVHDWSSSQEGQSYDGKQWFRFRFCKTCGELKEES